MRTLLHCAHIRLTSPVVPNCVNNYASVTALNFCHSFQPIENYPQLKSLNKRSRIYLPTLQTTSFRKRQTMCAFRLWFVVAVLVLIGFFGTDGATFLVKLEYDSLGHAFVKYKGKTYPCEKEQEVTLEDGNCRHNLYLKPPTQKERDERGGYVSGDVLCGYF